jgi:hypothetical protein
VLILLEAQDVQEAEHVVLGIAVLRGRGGAAKSLSCTLKNAWVTFMSSSASAPMSDPVWRCTKRFWRPWGPRVGPGPAFVPGGRAERPRRRDYVGFFYEAAGRVKS